MEKKPTTLPLVTSVPAFFRSNPDLEGADAPEIVTVQMGTLGGGIYLLPLSVEGARDLMVALSLWQPVMDVIEARDLSSRKLDN